GGGSAAFGSCDQALGDVEADGPLVRVRAGGRVDRAHGGRVENGGGHHGQVAQAPGGELPVLSEDQQWVRDRRARHPHDQVPLACRRSSAVRISTISKTRPSSNGLGITGRRYILSQSC